MARFSSGLVAFMLMCVPFTAQTPAPAAEPQSADERAVVKVIADRQAAWNAGDEQGYARLLTPHADIASSSGTIARGRDAVIRLYREQRTGVFAGAATAMRVVQVRLIRPDVAIVDVERELTGLRTTSVAPRSRTVFVLVKQADHMWLITAQRAGPQDRTGQ